MNRQIDELSLIRGLARHDEASVALVYRVYADSLFRFIQRRINWHYEDAEEIMQDTFVSALSLATTYSNKSSVFTWLCGIAKLRIADFYRHQGRKKRIPAERVLSLDDEASIALIEGDTKSHVDKTLDQLNAAWLLEHMIATLSEEEREALTLRYMDQFSVREIAHLMNRTERAVEHVLSRAKKNAATVAAKWLSGR